MALSVVINALSTRALEVNRGNAILYGLQLASMNLPRTGSLTPEPDQIVRQTFVTPEGLDLAEEPLCQEKSLCIIEGTALAKS